MSRPLRMLACVVAGLGAVAGVLWVVTKALATREVQYEGRTLDYWREQATNSDGGLSNRAVSVLTSVVVPRLTNQMFCDTNDSPWRLALVEQLDSLPGFQVAFVPADGRRGQAIDDLKSIGPPARPAIPALVEALRLRDPVLVGPAAKALPVLEADAATAVPALLGCLTNAEGHGDPEVVEALAEYGPRARAAVPALIKLLTDRSSKEIVFAVPKALKAIDPQAATGAGVK